jgi:hypothetical protein
MVGERLKGAERDTGLGYGERWGGPGNRFLKEAIGGYTEPCKTGPEAVHQSYEDEN